VGVTCRDFNRKVSPVFSGFGIVQYVDPELVQPQHEAIYDVNVFNNV